MKKAKRQFRHRPAPPPPIERLRDLESVIEPGRTYTLKLPDGTLYMARGSALLETGQLFLELADADRADDDERARRALMAIRADMEATAGDAVVLCATVGQTRGMPPPGTALTECHQCHRPLWISPENHETLEPAGVRPICRECLDAKMR